MQAYHTHIVFSTLHSRENKRSNKRSFDLLEKSVKTVFGLPLLASDLAHSHNRGMVIPVHRCVSGYYFNICQVVSVPSFHEVIKLKSFIVMNYKVLLKL